MNQKVLTRQHKHQGSHGVIVVPSIDEDEEGSIRPQLKRYDPDSMVYTDGSYQKDTNLTGAGVYGWKMGLNCTSESGPADLGQSTL